MNTAPEKLEPAVFLDLWQDKMFLGREFLTWLWVTSEINGNLLTIGSGQTVELWFENRIHLESGVGADRRIVTCQTPGVDWAEAHTALREGKKVVKGRLRVRTEEKEWAFSLDAETLTPQVVKLPKTFSVGEDAESESLAGRFLERVALTQELLSILELVYRQFLILRLAPAGWAREVRKMSDRINGEDPASHQKKLRVLLDRAGKAVDRYKAEEAGQAGDPGGPGEGSPPIRPPGAGEAVASET